jgi:hypothetical protein
MRRTILFDDFIEFSSFVDIFKVIRQTSAATVFYTHPNEFRGGLVEHFFEAGDGVGSQCQRRFERFESEFGFLLWRGGGGTGDRCGSR